MNKLAKSRFLKIATLSALLATWNTLTPDNNKNNYTKYQLPETITVQKFTRERAGFVHEEPGLEHTIATKDIDFNQPFDLVTDRYRLIRDEDSIISQYLGTIGSLPVKILLFDTDVGSIPDAEHAKAVLSMLEKDKSIQGLTVRLGHTRVVYDTWRMFTDPEIKKRNNFFARTIIGLPNMILGVSYAELLHGDHYMPLTQTVVLYSNVESIAGHEIGHHQDFQRFSRDWAYALSSTFPPAKIYKEFTASDRASHMIDPDDQWQVARYLFPAFLTYVAAAWALSYVALQKRKLKEPTIADKEIVNTFEAMRFLDDTFRNNVKVEEIKKEQRPKVPIAETARLFVHQHLMLGGAVGSYIAAKDLGELAASTAFVAGFLATDYMCDWVGDRIIPYEHENPGYRMITRRVAAHAYSKTKGKLITFLEAYNSATAKTIDKTASD